MAMRPRRSVLYVPGDNQHALEKAKRLPTDSIIIDLEDSVAPANKESARKRAIDVIREGGFGTREADALVNAARGNVGLFVALVEEALARGVMRVDSSQIVCDVDRLATLAPPSLEARAAEALRELHASERRAAAVLAWGLLLPAAAGAAAVSGFAPFYAWPVPIASLAVLFLAWSRSATPLQATSVTRAVFRAADPNSR